MKQLCSKLFRNGTKNSFSSAVGQTLWGHMQSWWNEIDIDWEDIYDMNLLSCLTLIFFVVVVWNYSPLLVLWSHYAAVKHHGQGFSARSLSLLK